MKKLSLLAVMIALALLLSGCTLKTVDPVADANQTILSVNGETVSKQTVANAVAYTQQMYSQYNSFYSQLGMQGQYPTDAATILEMVLDDQKDVLVARQQAVKLGLDQFTEEELAELQAKAEETYKSNLETIKSGVLVTDKLGDELEAEAKAYADAHGASLEDCLKDAKNQRLLEKIESYVKDPVTVTDEDVQKALDERVESEKASYEADKTVFGSNLNNGADCYYAPEGYRFVKRILLKFAEEDANAITAADTAVKDAEANYTSAQESESVAQSALDSAAEGADTAALQTALDEAKALTASALDELNAAKAIFEDANKVAAANIKAKADEVYALASAEGADFDALMAEYGEDDGMKKDPAMTNGYAVCEGFNFVEPFLNTALSMEKEGDVSEPVLSSFGYHIIKFAGTIQEGVRMTLDEARAKLESTLLSQKQQDAYTEALEKWVSEADVQTFAKKMGY